jgi:hypothetical protein
LRGRSGQFQRPVRLPWIATPQGRLAMTMNEGARLQREEFFASFFKKEALAFFLLLH